MANVNCETTELTDPDLVKYTIKARRMVGRWAGIRGPGRKNNNPSESVYTRGEGQESEGRRGRGRPLVGYRRRAIQWGGVWGFALSVAFVTRKKPRKEIPNQKSALRIGRTSGNGQKVSRLRGGRRLAKWGGKERESEREGQYFSSTYYLAAEEGLTFTIGWVYDEETGPGWSRSGELRLKTV